LQRKAKTNGSRAGEEADNGISRDKPNSPTDQIGEAGLAWVKIYLA